MERSDESGIDDEDEGLISCKSKVKSQKGRDAKTLSGGKDQAFCIV